MAEMTLREIYEKIGGDYDLVLSRLLDDGRIRKFLLKFVDSRMDVSIRQALEAGDYETAFREAHSLKGVCANLSLGALEASSTALTEALREGTPDGGISSLAQAVQVDYDRTVAVLHALSEE